jgi:pimeloyl-ACP methyl ester carboxylesterase
LFYPISKRGGYPNAKVVLYEKFGHNAWLDNREQYQNDILNFLKVRAYSRKGYNGKPNIE